MSFQTLLRSAYFKIDIIEFIPAEKNFNYYCTENNQLQVDKLKVVNKD